MVDLDTLFKKGYISRINELKIERYLNFFENSWEDNLKHSKKNIVDFPRWSIISSYYSMHDITKLLIVKRLRIKIDFKVHLTTINILDWLIQDKKLVAMLNNGYKEFLSLANDLEEAKKERIKVQYYTGTKFLKQEYRQKAKEFYNNAIDYINKIKLLIENTSV